MQYNVRLPGGGLEGLPELDVVGLNLKSRVAYVCEVTTHLHGMCPKSAVKIIDKHKQQREYAAKLLGGFGIHYMLWSPLVFPKQLALLQQIEGLELVVNKDFSNAVNELREIARKTKHDTCNPFMRIVQILEHLK